MDYDVAIVGGGPAGLQCALLLARARRSVALFDGGEPRNATVREAHGFFSRDAIAPADLLSIGREQLQQYDVRFFSASVVDAKEHGDGFRVTCGDGTSVDVTRMVVATGMRDKLPEIAGLTECWGISAFVCPYCDGWEVRDEPIAVWGNTRSGVELAQELYQWSHDIIVCADVSTPISQPEREWLDRCGVRVAGPIARLDHRNGTLAAIVLDDGTRLTRSALFMSVGLRQTCDLAERVGCRLTERGHIDVDGEYRTSIAGIYAVGDAVTHMHQIVFAAASGARAAIAINNELTGIA
ncbi:MAG TPA: NAD(P)/FAD-dependent oxidoreductase [Candidatus Aquilonibacter sp.]|nr:NAD(P)/FAD-dependent oxidoreductase [Candidatus Aquilonibacter sp.]